MSEWIKWEANDYNYEGPLPDEDTEIQVRYINGDLEYWKAGDIDWSADIHGDDSFIIDAYRIVEPKTYGEIDELGEELGFSKEELYSMNNNSKYDKIIVDKVDNERVAVVDVYSVLEAFDVRCPALQHLTKKSLNVGSRGHKNRIEDLLDIIDSAKRALELEKTRKIKNA